MVSKLDSDDSSYDDSSFELAVGTPRVLCKLLPSDEVEFPPETDLVSSVGNFSSEGEALFLFPRMPMRLRCRTHRMNIAIATTDGSTLASATVRTLFAAFDATEGVAAGWASDEEMGDLVCCKKLVEDC